MVDRAAEFEKPQRLEHELRFFESILGPLEASLLADNPTSGRPIVFIAGCARSGTTLLYQCLCQTGLFCYPSNFISRFFYAPYIGARLQQLLFDADFRGEINVATGDRLFESELGKTKGPLAPHEFWYFWRRFFKFRDHQRLCGENVTSTDVDLFRQEIRAFQSVFDRSLVMKAMIFNWHLDWLARWFDNSYFVHISRERLSNAASLLNARQMFFGNIDHWYSFKPPGFEKVLDYSPQIQILWQIHQTESAIRDGLNDLDTNRHISINYNELCAHPREICQSIVDLLQLNLNVRDSIPLRFDTQKNDFDRQTWETAERQFQQISQIH